MKACTERESPSEKHTCINLTDIRDLDTDIQQTGHNSAHMVNMHNHNNPFFFIVHPVTAARSVSR